MDLKKKTNMANASCRDGDGLVPMMSKMMEEALVLTAVGKLMFLGEEKDGNQLPVPGKPGLGRLSPSAQIEEGVGLAGI